MSLAVKTLFPKQLIVAILLILFALIAFRVSSFWPSGILPANHFIIDRYAAQLQLGHGLVFNPGERVLLVASPAYTLLIGALESLIAPLGYGIYSFVPRWTMLLTLGIGSYSVYRIARRTALSPVSSGIAAALYSFASPIWLGLGTAMPMATALSLLAFYLALASRWRLAGLVMALAILCSPEAAILGILLLLLAFNHKAGKRYGLAWFGSLAIAVLVLRLYYGATLWDGLQTLRLDFANTTDLILGATFIPLIALAIWGWYKHRTNAIVSICGAWVALYVLILAGILGNTALWKYAPIVAPILLLTMVGVRELKIMPVIAYSFVILMSLLPTFAELTAVYDPPPPAEFPTDVDKAQSIGVPSAYLTFYVWPSPNQSVISFDGQFQPDLKRMIERGDIQSALIRYAPDVLIMDRTGRINPEKLFTGAWARLDYRLLDRSNVYKRNAPVGTFVDQPTNIPYGPDMRLVGLALDQPSLQPGQLLRIRLDWELARPADRPITVDLQLTTDNKMLAQALDEFTPSVFQAGRWSTYHTITLADNVQPGSLALNVAVIVNDGTVARVPVAMLTAVPR